MRVAVVELPGSNCDHDTVRAFTHVPGVSADLVWHRDTSIGACDAVIVPGGFTYGDYLRAGALARFAPVIESVRAFSAKGGPVLGICNGFQILCEAGLLPGALARNASLKFEGRSVYILAEGDGVWSTRVARGRPLRVPIAHGEGRYVASKDVLDRLEGEGLVAFRYVDVRGARTAEANPNGSERSIAGIYNDARNVLGLMPHPERALEAEVGSADGLGVFQSLLDRMAA